MAKKELYFEEIGADFENWMSLYDVQQRVKLIKKFLPEHSKNLACLEIGCGSGQISKALKPLVGNLTVADISEKLARHVGEKLEVAWQRQDVCHLSIPDNEYELVISSECIEHTPTPRLALAEIGRVVKPGGWAIITSPNKLWYPVLWLAQMLKLRKFAALENWLTPWQAANVLKQKGFVNIKLGGCHLFPWQVPAAKLMLPFFDGYDAALYPLMINYGICGIKKKS